MTMQTQSWSPHEIGADGGLSAQRTTSKPSEVAAATTVAATRDATKKEAPESAQYNSVRQRNRQGEIDKNGRGSGWEVSKVRLGQLPSGNALPVHSEWSSLLQKRLLRKLNKPGRRARGAGLPFPDEGTSHKHATGTTDRSAVTTDDGDVQASDEVSPPEEGGPYVEVAERCWPSTELVGVAAAVGNGDAISPSSEDEERREVFAGDGVGVRAYRDLDANAPSQNASNATGPGRRKGEQPLGEQTQNDHRIRLGNASVVTSPEDTRQHGSPWNRRPPGGPFGAGKARTWLAQQVVQSAVTPMQVRKGRSPKGAEDRLERGTLEARFCLDLDGRDEHALQ